MLGYIWDDGHLDTKGKGGEQLEAENEKETYFDILWTRPIWTPTGLHFSFPVV